MKLFQEKQGELIQIEKDSFKLEKDIQALCEANMETLFELEFVSSEFRVAEFRLDSLAYDEQANAFVIVEYKKGHSYSLIDQGFSYLSVMLKNRAEFILEYNEKTGKQLKRDDIDWSATRILFIAPSFNAYQKNSVDFKDVPFELWEIKKFDGGLIALEQQVATSNESITKVTPSNSNSVIKEVSEAVKAPTEEDHTAILDDDLKQVWEAFKSRLLDLSNTSEYTTNSYHGIRYEETRLIKIEFRRKSMSCVMRRGNIHPDGKVQKELFILDDPKKLSKIHEWNRTRGGGIGTEYRFPLTSADQLDYAMYLVKQKYEQLS